MEVSILQIDGTEIDFSKQRGYFFHMDCMKALKEMPDKCFDLAIVDPIYGDVTGGVIQRVSGIIKNTTLVNVPLMNVHIIELYGICLKLRQNTLKSCLGCQKIRSYGEETSLLNLCRVVKDGLFGISKDLQEYLFLIVSWHLLHLMLD